MTFRKTPTADYGFDGSPLGVLLIGLVGIACLAAGITFVHSGLILEVVSPVLMLCGGLLLLVCTSYLYYVTFGKLHRRDKMLSMVDWKGHEMVLDIGTGRGLLMIGAAKRLTTGRSVGIDIWNPADMHGNSGQNTLRNAELEGVLDKVEVLNEDVRNLSFPDETFDVVLSNLCLHNIPTEEGRAKACREISRVLKPQGTAILADKSQTNLYAEILNQEGLTVEHHQTTYDGSLRRLVQAQKSQRPHR